MTNHTETQEGYGVLVTRKDGARYLFDDDDGNYFFRLKSGAVNLAAEKQPLMVGDYPLTTRNEM